MLEINFSSEYSSEGWAAVTIRALSINCKKVQAMLPVKGATNLASGEKALHVLESETSLSCFTEC